MRKKKRKRKKKPTSATEGEKFSR